jgi:hypothetical protein
VNELLDISFQPLGLMPLFYLYLGNLSFSFFFSRRSTGTPIGTQHCSSVGLLAAVAPHSTE